MRSALLLGRDHGSLGALAAVSEDRAAICLSRGGARKLYSHTEPNEDAVLFAVGEAGALVAVADGHHGSSGSHCAIELLESLFAARWTGRAGDPLSAPEAWHRAALDALLACNDAILAQAAERALPPAPTTLALALVRPEQDWLGWASVGDSHVFRVDRHAVLDHGGGPPDAPRRLFLGYEAAGRALADGGAVIGCEPLAESVAAVVATDGLSELGIGVDDPAASVGEAIARAREARPELRALEACRAIGQAAIESHRRRESGDNVGCGVLWLEG